MTIPENVKPTSEPDSPPQCIIKPPEADSNENTNPRKHKQSSNLLQTLHTHIKNRLDLLLNMVRPLSEKDTDEEVIVDAIERLRNEQDLRQLKLSMIRISKEMGVLYQKIVENDPEIGEIMSELNKLAETKEQLQKEIISLELDNEASTPKITREQLKEMAANQKQFESLLNTQQTKYQLRYTKAKEDVEAVVTSIEYIETQISSIDKRVLLMNQKGSNYSHKTKSEHSSKRMAKVDVPDGSQTQRPNSDGKRMASRIPNLS